MSGKGSSSQVQQSNTSPWSPAIPYLNKELTQVGTMPLTPSAGQTGAAQNLVDAAGNIPNLGPSVANTISGYFNPNFTNPFSNPGFSGAMDELLRQAKVGIGSQFAGAGRDPSGNMQGPEAIARGFAQGAAPTLASEYNTLLGFQQGAPSLASMIPGISLQGPEAQLGAATSQAQLPLINDIAAMQATIPVAGLGGQSYGTSNATYTPSVASQIQSWLNTGSNMFGAYNYGQPRTG